MLPLVNPQAEINIAAQFCANGGSLRMLTNVDEKHLQTLYAFACQRVEAGDMKSAEKLFITLFAFDCWNFDYALALGLCFQQKDAHDEALAFFSRAGMVKMTDPRPSYYAGLSYRKKGDIEMAKRAFNASLRWSNERAEYESIEQQAKAALETLHTF